MPAAGRIVLHTNYYSKKTEEVYIGWIKRFIFFHNKKNPNEMGKEEIENFINHLAVEKYVSSSTQNQALQAILFLYKKVSKKEIDWLDEIKHAVRIKHFSGRLKPIKYTHLLNRGLSVKSPLD